MMANKLIPAYSQIGFTLHDRQVLQFAKNE